MMMLQSINDLTRFLQTRVVAAALTRARTEALRREQHQATEAAFDRDTTFSAKEERQ